ncbi:putative secreted protein [Wickerhamomyces ciferrii]|uniref:Secreted protein n=1 Tax=Wickerhamomyces ciferrii (strain ATCC 14091 / BCRC 22168 / CBS 111 / JCM 3599 / NBRC 0793 / NRRL Y-1031 F-60-10) TaxID=1206466 RepID=K0KUW3_WICCF|nr:uncharacterized protein BN7_6630 [Wickerhamomyces ciferrii]CCH47021.1 putative secreted protein [Wickerhamomyces ciferrii]
MKLSTIVVQGLLLSGIIASPIADPAADPVADPVPDSADIDSNNLSNGNETASIEGKKKTKLCSDAGKDKACYLGSFGKCVPYYTQTLQLSCQQGDPQMRMACLSQQPTFANKYCGFWCAKLKTIDDCKRANKATGLGYKCKSFDYC